MAYSAPYIDDTGLHIPTYIDIRDDLIEQFKQIYGQDIYLDNDSQDYQMISAFALKTYDTMLLLQIVYNNRSPKTAVGTALDSIVKLNGIARKKASYSTCILTLTGDIGTTIAAGKCEDEQGNKWILPPNIRFEKNTINVSAQCETLGAVEAPVNTITKINTPQKGWLSVINKVIAIIGAPIETDEQLRQRQSISVAFPSQNMLDSTIAGIANITGVTRYKVYDNDTNMTDENGIPGHSIAAVVEGGLDYDIAEQIYLRKGPGGGTYGDVRVNYINLDGLSNYVYFYRPIYVPININVSVKPNYNYTTVNTETIRTKLTEYIANLDIGYDVSLTGILAAITDAILDPTKPNFSIKSLKIGKTDALQMEDIEIAFNEVAAKGNIKIQVI